MSVLKKKIVIRLEHTDAAGILFFANQLSLAHELYEQFLSKIGFPISKVINECSFLLPIVHTEADYLKKLIVGDELSAELTIEKIGTTSFTLDYQFINFQNELAGTAKTIHVTLDRKSEKAIAIPNELKQALLDFQSD